MAKKLVVSSVVWLDETAYYMSHYPTLNESTPGPFDDVWSTNFLSSLIIRTQDQCILTPDTIAALKDQGISNIYFSAEPQHFFNVPQGPCFLNNCNLHPAYRLYPDTAGASVVATVPAHLENTYRSLDAAAYGEQYPSALTVAIPSRLCHVKTDSKPYAGLRLAIKDIIDLKGLKTGASSRAYTSLYPVRSKTADAVQHLIDLGFVVVGKVKTTQFADSEWPTSDWVDYHAPFNVRGDGYLTTSGSSAGSAAAVAAYDWLDFSLGTDTLGSIRAPAAAQGIFGMRSSLGAASFNGILPYSPHFDTIGGFARTAEEFSTLATALYGSTTKSSSIKAKKSERLLYPTEYWPVSDPESQRVFETFISRLENYLGIEREPISIEDLWSKTRPKEITETLSDYLEHGFEWAADPDQWTGFLQEFVKDYENKTGKPPALNPQVRFKRDCLPTVTADQQSEASSNLVVLPWTTGVPDYRDRYRDGPQQFTDIGFFFYNIGPYGQAPEIIIPVGSTPYVSKFTGITEQLPATLGLVGAKGSDVWLANLVKDFVQLTEGDKKEDGQRQTSDPKLSQKHISL
ncbi:glutamyl-tRNA amidotransferase [Podospora fimiseda]|uniref:Glutamyl-tRNA amidotransferase n=1 Tax=Podospora fimiseda TaxID=252190 RepID=A0AAN7H654_9PEZI|nr:glutamyl-tRNA amidotransferase [Podospora fimiseda]